VTRYRTIVADPPWAYPEGFVNLGDRPHKQDRDRGMRGNTFVRTQLPYPSLSISEIEALPVSELADEDARLFLWATNRYLPQALGVATSWGFTYKQMLVWDKTPCFPVLGGSVAPNAAEYLIVAVRGKPARMGRWGTSIIRARKPRSEHSRKPDVFLDLVEQVAPGPYLELFARRQRLGWDVWGDEVESSIEMAS
jgi:N6-adenosine-specific RNA methylase IME4